MRMLFFTNVLYALSIIAASVIYSRAGIVPKGSALGASGQNLSISSFTLVVSSLGSPISWAEEEGWPEPPVYELQPEHIEALRLTKEQEEALRNYMPDFTPWTIADYPTVIKHYPYSRSQLPYIVRGDFDGNGRFDLIIAGRNKGGNKILAIMSRNSGYYVHPLYSWNMHGTSKEPYLYALFLLRKGITFALDGEGGEEDEPGAEEVMRQDGIQLAQMGANSASFTGRSEARTLFRYKEEITGIYPIAVSSTAASIFKPDYLGTLVLPPAMEKAVSDYDKNFKIWNLRDYPVYITEAYPYSVRSLPYAVKGDFNGDGVDDMVIAGHNNVGNSVITLLSNTTGYFVREGGDRCYLETSKLGKQIPYMPSEVLRIHEKGLEVPYYNQNKLTMTLDTEVYSIQTIASCSTEDGNSGTIYGDWHKIVDTPDFFGHVKDFYTTDYHFLRLIKPSVPQRAGNYKEQTNEKGIF